MLRNINLNGEIIPSIQTLFQADNRSFKYGDGLFETIRVFEGKAPFLNHHFKRLKKGMVVLKYQIPDYFSAAFFQKEIKKLTEGKGNHRVRVTVFRSSGGFYAPKNNQPQFLIENNIYEGILFQLNKIGLEIGLFEEMKISFNILSPLKTCNSLPYILAGIHSKENGFDDCFIFNNFDNVAESSNSNLFILKNNILLTPLLSEACVDGTMRKIIIQIAQSEAYEIKETSIQIATIKQADEVWLTNAIHGIRWVEKFEDQTFDNKIAKDFVKLLNEKIT